MENAYAESRLNGHYLVHKMGHSSRGGEKQLNTLIFTSSPFEVVEVLTIRSGGNGAVRKEPYLPMPSARCLAAAAAFDDGIKDAYVNRAVI